MVALSTDVDLADGQSSTSPNSTAQYAIGLSSRDMPTAFHKGLSIIWLLGGEAFHATITLLARDSPESRFSSTLLLGYPSSCALCCGVLLSEPMGLRKPLVAMSNAWRTAALLNAGETSRGTRPT